MNRITKSKQKESIKINEQIEEFFAKGGKITQLSKEDKGYDALKNSPPLGIRKDVGHE